ncbi:MAG: M23 family metallopeptidase [Bacilli bacterium]|nr:M23 family metallopeptidase [Bacilli bacterium]
MKKDQKNTNKYYKYSIKFLFTIILTLLTLIILKSNVSLKSKFYKKVFEESITFITINDMYEKYFGSPIPFSDIFKNEVKAVFNEKLKFYKQSIYKDGVSLLVDNNYLVPILESGMVIYVGNKDDYGKTVIVKQIDGLETWYGNLSNISVNLYDYVEKGNLLGETKNDKLYLAFKKNDKFITYEEHI